MSLISWSALRNLDEFHELFIALGPWNSPVGQWNGEPNGPAAQRPPAAENPHWPPGAGGLHLRAHRLHQRSHWGSADQMGVDRGLCQVVPKLTHTLFRTFLEWGECEKWWSRKRLKVFTIFFHDFDRSPRSVCSWYTTWPDVSFSFGRQWVDWFGPNRHSCSLSLPSGN